MMIKLAAFKMLSIIGVTLPEANYDSDSLTFCARVKDSGGIALAYDEIRQGDLLHLACQYEVLASPFKAR